jgi:hypothetical protein
MCARFGVYKNWFTFGNFTYTQVGALRTNTEGNAQLERPQLDPGLPPRCIVLEELLVERD